MSDTWTIGELAEHAARALSAGAQPVNGRVRDVPGERLIRWYTTIGLVDPPLTRRGRIARYGRRHLLQLVAIKRMQAAGHSIAQIQTTLTGVTDATLEVAAHLGDATPLEHRTPSARAASDAGGGVPSASMPSQDVAVSGEPDGLSQRGRFWAERVPPIERKTGEQGVPPGRSPVPGGAVVGVRLGEGVRLVMDAGRVPSEEDVQAVLAAAGPLLAVLEERRLV